MEVEVEDLVAAAKEDPQRVIAECNALVATTISPRERSGALRARSIAERALGDLAASMASATHAVEVATAHSLDEQAGLAWGTLGASRLYAGEIEQARDALQLGRGLVDGAAGLQLDMHMAGLHARTGEVEDAHELFGQVAQAAEGLGDFELAGDALGNRGTLAGYTGRLEQAEADLGSARDLFAAIGKSAASGQMTHNLGWIAALRGNYQQALDLYRIAAETLTGFDFWEDAVHLLDRAEAKLNAGLFSEAASDADSAARTFAEHAAHADEAEARLVAAHGSLAAGNDREALDQAEAAVELFRDQERTGWLAEARLVSARCGETVDVGQLQQIADELDVAGQRRAALTARLLLARGDVSLLKTIDKRQLSLSQAALYEDIAAGELAAGGETEAALELIRNRFESTAEIRATIDSTDVRAGLTAVWRQLGERAKSLSRSTGDDANLFEFAEWGSLALVEPPPVEAPNDQVLAAALGQMRSMQSALRSAERDFDDIADLPAQIARAESQVADLARQRRRQEPSSLTRPIQAAAISASFGRSLDGEAARVPEHRLCRFVTCDGRLIRIDIDAAGIRSLDLADATDVRSLANELQLSLERFIGGSGSERLQQAAERSVHRIVASLDKALFPEGLPDGDAVGDETMVVPTVALSAIPWSFLPSRQGLPTIVLPAASMIDLSPKARSAGRSTSRSVVAVAGPGLANTDHEATAVAAVYGEEARLLLAGEATARAVRSALAGADVAHVAAHGHLRLDQPMLSSIELIDGPLTVFDLHRLLPAPHVVVLANCFSARGLSTDGGELIGAAAVLLGAGTSWVVGCPVALPDDAETRHVMVALHTQLVTGVDVPDALVATIEALAGRAKSIAQTLVVFGCSVAS